MHAVETTVQALESRMDRKASDAVAPVLAQIGEVKTLLQNLPEKLTPASGENRHLTMRDVTIVVATAAAVWYLRGVIHLP